ncbi:efflux RND transporter periplasmic adaptor subunit [Devosia sp.]|uniref:efflux RND transporter periplasmic adaptor subunit n=1 Tax=Devosia sp. TaxID=1871048 RepID=UPI003265E988
MLAPSPEINDLLETDMVPNWWTRYRTFLIWSAACVALIAGVVVWWSWSSNRAAAISYQTTAAKTGDLTISVAAMGTMEPIRQVEVGSEIAGTIEAVSANYNDVVTSGQILAQISTDQLTDQTNRTRSLLDAAKATVIDKQAGLAQADRDLSRVAPLALHDLMSKQDLEAAQTAQLRAQAALASAAAQVEVAQADLASNLTQLGKAVIRSPIDGIILDRNLEIGQTVPVAQQSVLFTIADDLRRIHLLVDVDEADIGSVKQGQQASFTVEAYPDRSFNAKVEQVRFAPIAVSGVVSYKSVLSVDNAELLLRPGMTASAEIVTKQISNALLIPNAALRYAPSQAAAKTGGGMFGGATTPKSLATTGAVDMASDHKQIWLLEGTVATPVTITIGMTDGTWTQVLAGDLAAADLVIIDSAAAN